MNIIYLNKNEPALGFGKVHTNHAKLLREKVILTLTGLPRNKSLDYLETSDSFQ